MRRVRSGYTTSTPGGVRRVRDATSYGVDVARVDACERCGSAVGGTVGGTVGVGSAGEVGGTVGVGPPPWCETCLALLAGSPPAGLRAEYRRDYQRAYQRRLRASRGPARLKWVAVVEGRRLEIALRRFDERVVVTGAYVSLEAARRLVYGVLGCPTTGAVERALGGGRGSRRHVRFRITAPIGSGGEAGIKKVMRAMDAVRVEAFSGGE